MIKEKIEDSVYDEEGREKLVEINDFPVSLRNSPVHRKFFNFRVFSRYLELSVPKTLNIFNILEFIRKLDEVIFMTKHVLIVDDEAADLETMKSILEKEGYEVSTATNGADALDHLTGDNVDLILIDIRMPTLSGYELLRLMREKINSKSKMVFVSIVPEKEVNMEGADGFIQKPFSPETFTAKVKEVLGD